MFRDAAMSRVMQERRRSDPRGRSFASTGFGSRGPSRGQQPGNACTIDGKEGRLKMVNGELQCVALRSQDAKPLIVDGYGNSGLALNRPGFRVSTNDARQSIVDAAYSGKAQAYMEARRDAV